MKKILVVLNNVITFAPECWEFISRTSVFKANERMRSKLAVDPSSCKLRSLMPDTFRSTSPEFRHKHVSRETKMHDVLDIDWIRNSFANACLFGCTLVMWLCVLAHTGGEESQTCTVWDKPPRLLYIFSTSTNRKGGQGRKKLPYFFFLYTNIFRSGKKFVTDFLWEKDASIILFLIVRVVFMFKFCYIKKILQKPTTAEKRERIHVLKNLRLKAHLKLAIEKLHGARQMRFRKPLLREPNQKHEFRLCACARFVW